MQQDQLIETDHPDVTTPRVRRWWLVVIAIAAGVLVLTLGWWATHPKTLPPDGNEVGAMVAVGERRILSPVVSPNRRVKLVSIRPYDPSGARPRVTFHACRPRQLTGIMLMPATVDSLCESARSVGGISIGPQSNPGEWVIVMEVTLLEEGLFEMKGFEVEYWDGMRRGSQVTGIHSAVHTEGHRPGE